MPGATPRLALPYPLGSDPVAQGDDIISQLAAILDAGLPFRIAAGTVAVVANALAPSGGATFGPNLFPAGRFSVAPLVLVTPQVATSGANSSKVTAHAITKDQFYVGLQNANPTSAMTFASTPCAWVALQLLPAAAPG